MNKNCIILEICKETVLDPDATPPGSLCARKETGRIYVWPDSSDYDGPCVLYTPEEAAIEVAQLSKDYRSNRYQIVVIGDIAP